MTKVKHQFETSVKTVTNMHRVNHDVVNIFIFGEIGEWWGFNKMDVYNALDQKTVNEINVYISSDGGEVVEAFVIYDLLKGHKAQVNTYIVGLAASSATIIASAGDTVYMSEQSLYMIHRATWGGWGNADEIRHRAEVLEKLENRIVNIYENRTGLEESTIRDLMGVETWFEPNEALALDFVDEILDGIEIDFEAESANTHSYYYDDWFYNQLKTDSSGKGIYQNRALDYLGKGFEPYKLNVKNKLSKMENFIQTLVDTAVNLGLIKKSDKDKAVKNLSESEDLQSKFQDDLVKSAVNDAVKNLKPKNELTFDSLKELLEAASDEQREELSAYLVTDDNGEGGAAEDKGGESGKGSEAKEDEAITAMENKIKNLTDEIARMKGSGGKKPNNGKNDLDTGEGKKTAKPISAARKKFAVQAYNKGSLTAEQYEKMTGEKAPSRK